MLRGHSPKNLVEDGALAMIHIKLQVRSGHLMAAFFFVGTLAFAQTPSFKPPQAYAVGTTPVSAATGDFNGDGIPDIAVANSGSNNVSVLLGKGDGTFGAAINYDAGVSPSRVIVADINGDGKLDIAVLVNAVASTSAPGMVSTLVGNGNGTFQPPILFALTSEQNPFAVIDLNGDKKADLVINLVDDAGNMVGVGTSLGNGDGMFQTAIMVPNAPSVAAVADINNDGNPDLVVSTAASAQLMYGNGDGTFSPGAKVTPSDGGGVGRIWAGDLNGDGKLDLVMESYLGLTSNPNETDIQQDIGAFLNNGNTFGGEKIFLTGVSQKANPFAPPTYSFISEIAIGDFNGDGHADVVDRAAVVRTSNPPFAVNLGDGAGNFTAVAMTDPGPFATAADLSGHQLTDLVLIDAPNNDIDVLLNSTPTFMMAAASATLTADAGQQITDALKLTAFNGFSASIQLSCQVVGPSPTPTCSLSPTSVTGNGSSTLTITIPSGKANMVPTELTLRPPALAFLFGMCLLGLVSNITFGRAASRTRSGLLAATITLVCASCGGGGGTTISPPHQYSVVVAAAASSFSRAVQISLTAP